MKRTLLILLSIFLFANLVFAETQPAATTQTVAVVAPSNVDAPAKDEVDKNKSPETDDKNYTLTNTLTLSAKNFQETNKEMPYTISAVYPAITGKDISPAAQKFNHAIDAMVKEEVDQFKKYVKADVPHMKTLPEAVRKNTLTIDYDYYIVKSNKIPVVSIRLNVEGLQAGRAHPYHKYRVLTIDLNNKGKILALNDLFKPGIKYLQAIAKYCKQQLSAKLKDKWMIDQGTVAKPANYKNWNMQSDSLLITFDEYQVAPYVYGAQEVEIPYKKLANILAPNSAAAACLKDQCG